MQPVPAYWLKAYCQRVRLPCNGRWLRELQARTSLTELHGDDAPPHLLRTCRRGRGRARCAHRWWVACSRTLSAQRFCRTVSCQRRALRARHWTWRAHAPPVNLVTPGPGRLHHAGWHAGAEAGRAAPLQGAPRFCIISSRCRPTRGLLQRSPAAAAPQLPHADEAVDQGRRIDLWRLPLWPRGRVRTGLRRNTVYVNKAPALKVAYRSAR